MEIVSFCAIDPSVALADVVKEVPAALAVREISPLFLPAAAVTLAAIVESAFIAVTIASRIPDKPPSVPVEV